MNTLKLVADDTEEGIKKSADILKNGGLVAIPTETVYGLAANALDGKAVAKIFRAKGRPQDNPLIVHISDISQMDFLVKRVNESAKRLAERFWPGPLTIVLEKSEIIPDEVSAGLNTVAIRMPLHTVAQKIIEFAGVPLAAPSANLSGSPSPTTAKHCIDDLDGRVDAIIDGGDCIVGVESTVITLVGEKPRLLRPGGVTLEQMEEVIGKIDVDTAVLHQIEKDSIVSSPGMKYKHYSPKANVTIVHSSFNQFCEYIKNNANKDGTYALCFDGEEKYLSLPYITYGKIGNDSMQAQRLFDALREIDDISAKQVYARAPKKSGVGMAVYNRLVRAAGFEEVYLNKGAFIIGITGPSGSGKSFVCEMIQDQGVPLIDADKVSREILQKGSSVLKELQHEFGDDILFDDGTLNRRLLSNRAFVDKQKSKRLNEITHPAIMKNIEQKIKIFSETGNKYILLDAALLIESCANHMCNKIIAVVANKDVRLQRIIKRDNISLDEAEQRIAVQQENEFYMNEAHYTIENNGDTKSLRKKVTDIMRQIKEESYDQNCKV